MTTAIRRRDGVTLIELMVVVSIIGILMSLVAMATISAREKGRMTMCTNNHKQMITAWLLYAADYNDRLVPNPDSDKLQWKGWVVGNLRIPTVATNTALMLDSEYSLFGPYISKAEIYKCPSDES